MLLLGAFECSWVPFGSFLGASWAPVGALLGGLEVLLGGLGAIWGHKLIFDSILVPSWVPFWLPKSTPKPSKIVTENCFKKDA